MEVYAKREPFTYLSKDCLCFTPFYILHRKFVERELFKPDEVPERHNLSFFPTVNDIKNHIHEVQKSLRNGDNVYNSEIIPATV